MAEADAPSFEERFDVPIFSNGRFMNPWSTWRDIRIFKALQFFLLTRDESAVPKEQEELDRTLPVMKPDFTKFENSPKDGIRHMWIGHASSLVQMDGITLLTDPIFSDRCAPFQWMGTKRYRPPPCSVADLPKIDCVVISHNHYDHLDYYSVKDLNDRFGDNLRWYVPMGLKQWMNDCGCNNVVELTWWQEHVYDEKSGIKFVSTPCQHWCRRGVTDINRVLWSSWCVIGSKHKFYFAGDTGYCEGFKQIGRRYGPFNLATIPIGAYNPRWITSPQHVDPKEAVDIHLDVKSKQSIGIHWGTFKLTYEPYLEPRLKLKEELKKRKLLPSSFVTVTHGDIKVFKGSD